MGRIHFGSNWSLLDDMINDIAWPIHMILIPIYLACVPIIIVVVLWLLLKPILLFIGALIYHKHEAFFAKWPVNVQSAIAERHSNMRLFDLFYVTRPDNEHPIESYQNISRDASRVILYFYLKPRSRVNIPEDIQLKYYNGQVRADTINGIPFRSIAGKTIKGRRKGCSIEIVFPVSDPKVDDVFINAGNFVTCMSIKSEMEKKRLEQEREFYRLTQLGYDNKLASELSGYTSPTPTPLSKEQKEILMRSVHAIEARKKDRVEKNIEFTFSCPICFTELQVKLGDVAVQYEWYHCEKCGHEGRITICKHENESFVYRELK